jgi:flagellin
MSAGTLTIDNYDNAGHLTGTMGGENFAGDLPAAVDGAFASVTLTGDQGDTVTLSYKQAASGALVADEAFDIWQAAFTFTASGSGATVANLTAAPTATSGTYSFSSTALGTITLTGPGGSQTVTVNDTAANTSQTLNFNNLGIRFDLQANGVGGFSKESAIGNLTSAGNDSIVVTGSPGSPGVGGTVITGAGSGATFQIGANQGDTLGVTFADARTSAYGGFDAAIAAFTTAANNGTGIAVAAGALITATDTAIGAVSSIRASFGAVENRLNHTVASISVASENLNASQSRIKDLDVAAEMVNFTKTQILQQAGTSILAQANSAPQNILTLLR